MMGIARLGGICVALNPAFQVPEVEYSFKKVGVKAVIITEAFKTQNYYKMLVELFPEMQRDNARISKEGFEMEKIIVDSDERLR